MNGLVELQKDKDIIHLSQRSRFRNISKMHWNDDELNRTLILNSRLLGYLLEEVKRPN